ncbi:MAG: hypothetical protein WBB45_03855 [Cyclobacteriaceae bacterium]
MKLILFFFIFCAISCQRINHTSYYCNYQIDSDQVVLNKIEILSIKHYSNQLVYQYADGSIDVYTFKQKKLESFKTGKDSVQLTFFKNLTVFINKQKYIISKFQSNSLVHDSGLDIYYAETYGVIYKRHRTWPSYTVLKSDSDIVDALIKAIEYDISCDSLIFIDKQFNKEVESQIEEDF